MQRMATFDRAGISVRNDAHRRINGVVSPLGRERCRESARSLHGPGESVRFRQTEMVRAELSAIARAAHDKVVSTKRYVSREGIMREETPSQTQSIPVSCLLGLTLALALLRITRRRIIRPTKKTTTLYVAKERMTAQGTRSRRQELKHCTEKCNSREAAAVVVAIGLRTEQWRPMN